MEGTEITSLIWDNVTKIKGNIFRRVWLTLFPAEALTMRCGTGKYEIITRNWPYELSHELQNDLRLKIFGNLKAVYLSFHWFDNSWTHGFGLVTRRFELVTRRFELVTRGFELVTRRFELVTRGLELVTREAELITRGFEVALFNFN